MCNSSPALIKLIHPRPRRLIDLMTKTTESTVVYIEFRVHRLNNYTALLSNAGSSYVF